MEVGPRFGRVEKEIVVEGIELSKEVWWWSVDVEVMDVEVDARGNVG